MNPLARLPTRLRFWVDAGLVLLLLGDLLLPDPLPIVDEALLALLLAGELPALAQARRAEREGRE